MSKIMNYTLTKTTEKINFEELMKHEFFSITVNDVIFYYQIIKNYDTYYLKFSKNETEYHDGMVNKYTKRFGYIENGQLITHRSDREHSLMFFTHLINIETIALSELCNDSCPKLIHCDHTEKYKMR